MNLPDASKLCEFAKIWIYDHHLATKVECAQEHFNPFLEGKSYPSATLVVMERFNLPFDYIVALGIIGDNGPKTKQLKEYELIKKSSLEQSFLTLAKNQFFMLAEKVKLIPNYVAWSGYWLGLRLLWPFREIKLARELRKYKELFSALLDNIPCKVLVIKDKVYSNLEDEELGELEEKLETILGSKTGETGEWKYVVKEGKSGEKIVILDKK